MRLVDVTHTAVWADALAVGQVVGRSWPSSPKVMVRRTGQEAVDLARRVAEATAQAPGRVLLRIPVPGDPAGLEPSTLSALPDPWPPAILLWRPLDVRDGTAAVSWVPQAGSRDLLVLDEVRCGRLPEGDDLATASRGLAEAMREASTALALMDVAQGRDGAQARLDELLRASALPSGCDPKALALLDRALRLVIAVGIATEDDGRSLSSSEAAARRSHLTSLGAAARRALEAAAAACADGTGTVARP